MVARNTFDRDDLLRRGGDRFDDRDRFGFERDPREREDDSRDRMELERENAIIRLQNELLMEVINDPNVQMTPDGELQTVAAGTLAPRRRTSRTSRPSGRQVIRSSGQFSRSNILPPLPKPRKKNKKHCKNLSECFKEANSKLRNKNGQLKKGKTQADVARMAQKLLRKIGKGTKKGQVRKTARRAFEK